MSTNTAEDRLLTVLEVAALLRINRHTVTKLFAAERGVLIFGDKETVQGSRRYRELRIPTSVLNRVCAHHTNR